MVDFILVVCVTQNLILMLSVSQVCMLLELLMLEVLNIKDEVHVVILVVLDLDVNNVHVNMVEVRDVVNVIKRLVVALVLETMLEVFRKGAEIYLRNLKHV